jgi:hypothetical protein
VPAAECPTGVLIIRVRTERGATAKGLRARITCVRDVREPEEEQYDAATVEDIVDVVRAFVEPFQRRWLKS